MSTSDTQTMSESETNTSSEGGADTQERHTAVRAFAAEFGDATYQFKTEESERAPKYTLLPTGERANRFLIVGTLTNVEENETDNGTFVSARVNDGVENYYLTASRYQPDAKNKLLESETPSHITIVAKANHWETDEGEKRIELIPESVTEITVEDRKQWVLETARMTVDRAERLKEYTDDSDDAPADIRLALDKYGSDVDAYLAHAEEVIDAVVMD